MPSNANGASGVHAMWGIDPTSTRSEVKSAELSASPASMRLADTSTGTRSSKASEV